MPILQLLVPLFPRLHEIFDGIFKNEHTISLYESPASVGNLRHIPAAANSAGFPGVQAVAVLILMNLSQLPFFHTKHIEKPDVPDSIFVTYKGNVRVFLWASPFAGLSEDTTHHLSPLITA